MARWEGGGGGGGGLIKYIWHRRNILRFRATTSIFSQWLLNKLTDSRAVFTARLHVKALVKELNTQPRYLLVISWFMHCFPQYQKKQRSNVISTFTEFTWPWRRMLTNGSGENIYFRGVLRIYVHCHSLRNSSIRSLNYALCHSFIRSLRHSLCHSPSLIQ